MITKRQLGIFIVVFGLIFIGAIFIIEWIGAGNFQGIGPLQSIALIGSAFITLVGLTLIPLGNRPA